MTDEVTDGTDIIGELLRAHTPLLEIVPAANIKAGRLSDDADLNAIVVTEISQVERSLLHSRGVPVPVIDRVAVTGRFRSHRERKAAMRMIKDCCAGRTGTIAGILNVSITSAGRGPDLNGIGDSFEKTQDFRVSYSVYRGE